jgi:hypothetical protein
MESEKEKRIRIDVDLENDDFILTAYLKTKLN